MSPRSQPKILRSSQQRGFTLIELILVMTVLTIAVSLTAPALANFFRGRTLDSEARRLLALTRQGQSRAASEGIPMELWVDTTTKSFGLEAEPSYEETDPKALTFSLDTDIQLEAVNGTIPTTSAGGDSLSSVAGQPRQLSNHPNLPRIRFLPDGTLSDISPQALRLTGRDGSSICLAQTRNRLAYEIRPRVN
jgi:type II secretion system protein H